MGVYGQRQGGTNQMVRVKMPWGGLTPDQIRACAEISERYSRGWGHLTTRQNFQFHYVDLDHIPEVLRVLGRAGMTTREACGDTVRNVQGCHLAGACPFEKFDITPWAEAAYRYFVRHPFAQRLPRKFKINFSGCETDCGQAMFNDAGVIAVQREAADGTTEFGFRVFVAGGLGANPHPALALEEFTPKAALMPTLEAILRVFEQAGNRDNKLRARLKWVVDELGFEEVQARILKQREHLTASSSWPGGIPTVVTEWGDEPAGVAAGVEVTPMGQGTPVSISANDPYTRWQEANVVRGVAKGTVSAMAWARLGDITTAQLRSLADIQEHLGAEVRVTNRQNLVYRGLTEDQLPWLFEELTKIDMAQPGAELSRDVVACPGADTCNLAVTQSRGLASAISEALEEAGLAEVGGIRTNISGCTNSCGQHHVADIGFQGAERRAHGRSAPGYQMLLGGYVGQEQIEFGKKALRLPAKSAPAAVVEVVGRFATERDPGERFSAWIDRVGGAGKIGEDLAKYDEFPKPEDNPDFYVDYGETGPYEKVLGQSECA
jgi:sulfite reductase (ferredoxin)